jgi:hypothetical protein
MKLTAERARECIDYNPTTGEMFWKVRGRNRRPGRVAGSICKQTGRKIVMIDGYQTRTYRLAWLIMTGEWPKHTIDHINGDPSDDRWCNLREATHAQQNGNMPPKSNSRLGVRGVSLDRSGKFMVRIKGRYVGMYATLDEAARAYAAAAEKEYGEFRRRA